MSLSLNSSRTKQEDVGYNFHFLICDLKRFSSCQTSIGVPLVVRSWNTKLLRWRSDKLAKTLRLTEIVNIRVLSGSVRILRTIWCIHMVSCVCVYDVYNCQGFVCMVCKPLTVTMFCVSELEIHSSAPVRRLLIVSQACNSYAHRRTKDRTHGFRCTRAGPWPHYSSNALLHVEQGRTSSFWFHTRNSGRVKLSHGGTILRKFSMRSLHRCSDTP